MSEVKILRVADAARLALSNKKYVTFDAIQKEVRKHPLRIFPNKRAILHALDGMKEKGLLEVKKSGDNVEYKLTGA